MSLKVTETREGPPMMGGKKMLHPAWKRAQKIIWGAVVWLVSLVSGQKLKQEILSGNKEKVFHPWDNQAVEQPKEVVLSLSIKVFEVDKKLSHPIWPCFEQHVSLDDFLRSLPDFKKRILVYFLQNQVFKKIIFKGLKHIQRKLMSNILNFERAAELVPHLFTVPFNFSEWVPESILLFFILASWRKLIENVDVKGKWMKVSK